VKIIIEDPLIKKVKKWLGLKGIKFFNDNNKKYKRIDAIWLEGGIPHVVHFREGMQVRNFLRTLPECKKWNSHDFDNNWVEIVERAIKEKI